MLFSGRPCLYNVQRELSSRLFPVLIYVPKPNVDVLDCYTWRRPVHLMGRQRRSLLLGGHSPSVPSGTVGAPTWVGELWGVGEDSPLPLPDPPPFLSGIRHPPSQVWHSQRGCSTARTPGRTHAVCSATSLVTPVPVLTGSAPASLREPRWCWAGSGSGGRFQTPQAAPGTHLQAAENLAPVFPGC